MSYFLIKKGSSKKPMLTLEQREPTEHGKDSYYIVLQV